MKSYIFNLLTFLTVIVLTAACSTGGGHFDANGVVLTIDGEEVARQEISTVTYTTGNSIDIEMGQSVIVAVQFLDDDMQLITPDDPDEFLQIVIANDSIVRLIGENRDAYTVTLEGAASGQTNIQFEVWHGDHADYTSQPFLFNVVATE